MVLTRSLSSTVCVSRVHSIMLRSVRIHDPIMVVLRGEQKDEQIGVVDVSLLYVYKCILLFHVCTTLAE